MDISIDEAGSFVNASHSNAWCVVAALVSPETEKRKLNEILRNLKLAIGHKASDEIKLYQVTNVNETIYIDFLYKISSLKCSLFSVATDTSLNIPENVKNHKLHYENLIFNNIKNMVYDGGKIGMEFMGKQLSSLPIQLYTQLCIQVTLIHDIIDRAINYYVQRSPATLSSFKWRIDQKQPSTKTNYEDVFEKLCPALLQAFSIEKPGALLNWCDYSAMHRYFYSIDTLPEYLIGKVPSTPDNAYLDIQKIFRDDIKFIDSKDNINIQIIDLLASGLRRLLRQEFINNELVAHAFSKLFIQPYKNKSSLKLVIFGDASTPDAKIKSIVKIINKNSKIMLKS